VRSWPALLLAGLLASGAARAEWGVPQLMARLAARGAAEATFVERRYVPVLDAPVASSGTLRFVPPDRLEKNTVLPRAESMVLAGDQLSLQQGSRVRRIALGDLPDGGVAIDSLRGTLAGDLKALQRGWEVVLHGDERLWTLSLTPLSPALARYIESVRIQGRAAQVERIDLRQADGVRSVMDITPILVPAR
jgi:hypothetical protein